ncbi:MAG: crotonase/enoyl-CoA hydratase family protein [Myxococcales bacterium]|nr:crotonase/enoyl-CoA hydratase family protein [Myxococcales bacterium]
MSQQSPRVDVQTDGAIAVVSLCRPDKHNGMDLQMVDELIAAAATLQRDRQIRGVIVHGQGPSFCAGLDIKSVMGSPARAAWAAAALLKPTINRFQKVNLCWRDLSVPVIAAIEGSCFGAGMQLALGADIRFATPDAQLSIMEAKWGLVPDMGGTVLLREVVGRDVALELTWTAKVLSGTEAEDIGLITRVETDPMGAAKALIEEIAQRSPDATAGAKHLFTQAWGADETTALAAERRWQLRMLRSKNQRIATKRNTKAPDTPFQERQW